MGILTIHNTEVVASITALVITNKKNGCIMPFSPNIFPIKPNNKACDQLSPGEYIIEATFSLSCTSSNGNTPQPNLKNKFFKEKRCFGMPPGDCLLSMNIRPPHSGT